MAVLLTGELSFSQEVNERLAEDMALLLVTSGTQV